MISQQLLRLPFYFPLFSMHRGFFVLQLELDFPLLLVSCTLTQLSYLPCWTQTNMEVMQNSIGKLNLTTYLVLYQFDNGYYRRNMLDKNSWETGFQNENGIPKISPKTRSWFLWHTDFWFFNNLPSCLAHLLRCKYNPSCLVWEGLPAVMPFLQTCLGCNYDHSYISLSRLHFSLTL